MIKYFNGKPFVKFSQYLQAEFPNLYSAWQKTDIKQTGNQIGKHFETKLMLDKSIYSRAEELGIIVGYEYDGMSFYAEDASQCQTLLEFIEQRSVALLGIKLVFVDKTAIKKTGHEVASTFDFASTDLALDMAASLRDFASQYEPLQKRAGKEARRNYKPNAQKSWKVWRQLRGQMDALMFRFADTIKYHAQKKSFPRCRRNSVVGQTI
jgi:hypothetical protein